jgi:hypothetical protein
LDHSAGSIRAKVEGFGAVVLVARPSPKTEGFGANSPGRVTQYSPEML